MSTESADTPSEPWGAWDRFWFTPTTLSRVALVRGILGLVAILYFLGCWSDLEFWYGQSGPLSTSRVASFLDAGDLKGPARWIISPLFLTDSLLIHRLAVVLGVLAAIVVVMGRGGRWAGWILWLLVVGSANRAMILSGLAESFLSLGLFASALAPPAKAWTAFTRDDNAAKVTWLAGLAERLLAVQISVLGAATFVTMLGGRVWFNGLGSYALAAPTPNRTIDWTSEGSILANPLIHGSLTHLMVVALPIGFVLAWRPRLNRYGQVVLIGWSLAVALLGSHWLYAMTFAAMVMSIDPRPRPKLDLARS